MNCPRAWLPSHDRGWFARSLNKSRSGKKALAAGNCKGHHNAVANLQRLVFGPDLDHLTHILVAEHVALLHVWNDTAIDVQVGAANRTSGHLDDGVPWMLNFGIRNFLAANVAFTVPSQGLHLLLRFCHCAAVLLVNAQARYRFEQAARWHGSLLRRSWRQSKSSGPLGVSIAP